MRVTAANQRHYRLGARGRGTCALLLTIIGAAPAEAACRSLPFEYSPLQNDARKALVYCDAAGGRMSLRDGLNRITGANVEFTSAKVLRHPRNGKLLDADGFSFYYTPRANAAKTDDFVIRICAKSGAQTGCSTITYQVTVQ